MSATVQRSGWRRLLAATAVAMAVAAGAVAAQQTVSGTHVAAAGVIHSDGIQGSG